MKTLEETKKTLEEEKAYYDKKVNEPRDPYFDDADMVDENRANLEGWIEALELVLK